MASRRLHRVVAPSPACRSADEQVGTGREAIQAGMSTGRLHARARPGDRAARGQAVRAEVMLVAVEATLDWAP